MINTILDALQQSLIFIPLTLGIYISYELLKVTDLTPDGSFVLGAAIFTRLLTNGYNQYMCIILSLLGGAIVGCCVALLQRFAKINSLIAGILAVFMLYSVNFSVMQQPNIGILNTTTLITQIQNKGPMVLDLTLSIGATLLIVIIFLLVKSKLGLKIRSYGSNKNLLQKLGIKPTYYLVLGLAISNMLVALCGAMTAQINGYCDIHMGMGMALVGIGAVVIGCKLIRTVFLRSTAFNITVDLIGCFVGTYIYFLLLNLFLSIGINPIHLKLLLGIVLTLFLSTANYTSKQHHSVAYNDQN